MHHATKSLCGECVWVSKWAAQLKTIMVAKWEVPVSKRERLPKRVVTVSHPQLSGRFTSELFSYKLVISSAVGVVIKINFKWGRGEPGGRANLREASVILFF